MHTLGTVPARAAIRGCPGHVGHRHAMARIEEAHRAAARLGLTVRDGLRCRPADTGPRQSPGLTRGHVRWLAGRIQRTAFRARTRPARRPARPPPPSPARDGDVVVVVGDLLPLSAIRSSWAASLASLRSRARRARRGRMISNPTSRPAISSTPITITTAIQAPEDDGPGPGGGRRARLGLDAGHELGQRRGRVILVILDRGRGQLRRLVVGQHPAVVGAEVVRPDVVEADHELLVAAQVVDELVHRGVVAAAAGGRDHDVDGLAADLLLELILLAHRQRAAGVAGHADGMAGQAAVQRVRATRDSRGARGRHRQPGHGQHHRQPGRQRRKDSSHGSSSP